MTLLTLEGASIRRERQNRGPNITEERNKVRNNDWTAHALTLTPQSGLTKLAKKIRREDDSSSIMSQFGHGQKAKRARLSDEEHSDIEAAVKRSRIKDSEAE